MKKAMVIVGENGVEVVQNCAGNPEEEKVVQEKIMREIRPEINRINERLQAKKLLT